ncbi:Cof-type HAD-IIB family hydrolase [Urinicoccus massiliensis]|uniref:Cof-type HAD-IIB family hydrolase n=1 Tax=Urinicoccus massiliensis TaxID=1723382 RepID=UPI000930328A|nr:Cof-type HAD-IIB family hydrolase [Urinicoccus massiliensis]
MGKFILFDLDGTLLTDDKKIGQEDIERLGCFIQEGHHLAVATGRRYFSAREILNRYGIKMPIIANNGAVIRDQDDRLIFRKALDMNLIEKIIETSRDFPVCPVFHIDGFHKAYDMVYHAKNFNSDLLDYLEDEPIRVLKIDNYLDLKDEEVLSTIYFGRDDILEDFQEKLQEHYPNSLSMHILRNLDQHVGILEIMPHQVNKFFGAQIMAQRLHKGPCDMITIGDDVNDLVLIQNARVGIAMANGPASVKSIADFVSDYDNNHCGATQAIEKYLKGGFCHEY